MRRPRVIFSHGLASSPDSIKIRRLTGIAEGRGFPTLAIDYRDTEDPRLRGERLAAYVSQEDPPPLLVGSSMGGSISLAVAALMPVAGLFLMAPAVGLPGYPAFPIAPKTDHIAIVAAWGDEIIPPENIFELGKKTGASLLFLDSDHRLSNQHEEVGEFFRQFLEKLPDC